MSRDGAAALPGLGKPSRRWRAAARLGAALALAAVLWTPPPTFASAIKRIDVTVVEAAGEDTPYVVEAELLVAVPLEVVWAVLTDFDSMANFVPNLTESRVASRAGDRLAVRQKGVARFGPFRFAFDTAREIELQPYTTVRSRQLTGNLRKVESTTQFTHNDGGTRVRYRVEVVPGFWLPGFIGRRLIEHEVREQFAAIVREITRRQSGATRPATVETPAAMTVKEAGAAAR